jgi:hypothetical protein
MPKVHLKAQITLLYSDINGRRGRPRMRMLHVSRLCIVKLDLDACLVKAVVLQFRLSIKQTVRLLDMTHYFDINSDVHIIAGCWTEYFQADTPFSAHNLNFVVECLRPADDLVFHHATQLADSAPTTHTATGSQRYIFILQALSFKSSSTTLNVQNMHSWLIEYA